MCQSILRIAVSLLLAFIFVRPASAQSSIGIRAAFNLSGIQLVDEENNKQETGMVPRFQIGLTVDIPIATEFYLQPAALYSGKGFKQDGGWLAASDNEFKATASYIEIPLNLIYKPRLGSGDLMVGAGPYAGYGSGGRWEADQGQISIGDIMIEPRGDVIFKNDVTDGEFGNYLYGKPWDYGVNVLAGYEFLQQVSVQLNAQFGIANLIPAFGGTERDGKIKNVVYGLSFGYRF